MSKFLKKVKSRILTTELAIELALLLLPPGKSSNAAEIKAHFYMTEARMKDLRNNITWDVDTHKRVILTLGKLKGLFGMEVKVCADLPDNEIYFVSGETFITNDIVSAHRLRSMFALQEAVGSPLQKQISKLVLDSMDNIAL